MALRYNFVQVFECGYLALSERPKIKEIKRLKDDGCSRVVTILPERGEKAHMIGKEVESCGMSWDWLKVTKATNFTNDEKASFKKFVENTLSSLKAGESVLVHCSAGLHRTGIFAYSVLIRGGMSHSDAFETIGNIRQETADAMEDKYIKVAEKVL